MPRLNDPIDPPADRPRLASPTQSPPFERLLAVVLPAALALACLFVIAPFAAPLLWAAVIVVSLWRPLERATALFGGRRATVATLLGLALLALLVVPAIALTDAAVEALPRLLDMAHGIGALVLTDVPGWLERIPLVGEGLAERWRGLAGDAEQLAGALARLAPEIGGWIARQTVAVGGTVVQLLLVAVATAVLYVHGPAGAVIAQRLAERIGGAEGRETLAVAVRAIRAVSAGVIGTSVVQALLAGIGFAVAGVPSALILAVAVLVLGIVQIGPLPVWLPVVLWMFATSERLLPAVLLTLWCAGVVQTVDNILRPLLISRGARLPLLLMLVGGLGGLISMGLIGVFLGPTLLGVGYVLLRRWLGLEPLPGRSAG